MKTHLLSCKGQGRVQPRFLLVVGLLFAIPGIGLARPDQAKGKGKAHANGPGFVPPGLAEKPLPPGLRRAPVEIVVTKVPPPMRTEKIPARPAPHYVWVPGYWMWERDAYIWLPGTWVTPPEPDALWVPPRFEKRSGVSIFISGYWRL